MSLGDRLIDELKRGADGPVAVDRDEVRATVDVAGSGPYGAEVRGVTVERTQPRGSDDPDRAQRMQQTTDRMGQAGYLDEPLQPLEMDSASGKGVLRTRRDRVRGREYYEVSVDGGDRVDVERFRGHADGGRERVSSNYGHGVLRRLVNDLEEAVGDRRERVRPEDE